MENLIKPEILDDEFHSLIKKYAGRSDLKLFLEIGSSSGEGSTDAFTKGIKQRKDSLGVLLFCMEVSRTRFKALLQHYAQDDFVRCYNISSIAANEFPSENEVINFYNSTKTNLNSYPLETVLEWRATDIKYITESGANINGIKSIKNSNNIKNFDMVLIDGSEFTGERELDLLKGTKVIALDDVNAFKCWNAYQILLNTSNYHLKEHNFTLRNGYAIFERKY